ncbi:hypothetical protein [Desulfonatronovibrio magnus]|uniref:hypothetical protein n=1 Tax=Desulfonatronovibrio magnus TaxID=698827 RepID=UPI000696A738|nr:hypothetical protein [Desulfonatronovibrio magnus]
MAHAASVIDLYESLVSAEDEKSRAKIIAGAFERLEERYPELKDLATAGGVRESELRLQKEIELVKLRVEEVRFELGREIEKARADLSKDIEQVRADLSKEIAQVKSDLTKDIEQVRADLSKEIAQVKSDLTKDIEQVRADLSKEIAQVKADLQIEIEQLRTEVKTDFASGNQKVIRWMTGLILTQLITIVTVIMATAML